MLTKAGLKCHFTFQLTSAPVVLITPIAFMEPASANSDMWGTASRVNVSEMNAQLSRVN